MTNNAVNETKVPDNSPVRRKRISRRQDAWHRMRKSKTAILGLIIMLLIVMVALLAPVLVDYEQDCIKPNISARFQGPNLEHFLGTDALGRDVLARMIYGARISLFVSVCAVLFSTTLGALFGSVAGFTAAESIKSSCAHSMFLLPFRHF
jgi:peptide/nickel transport system permease protein